MKNVFNIEPDYATVPEVSFLSSRDEIYFPGTIKLIEVINKPIRTVNYTYTCLGKVDEITITTFFNDRKGKVESFLLPIWDNFYEALIPFTAGNNYINIKHCNAHEIYNPLELIYVCNLHNILSYFQIEKIEEIDEDIERITFINYIEDTIELNQIKFLSSVLLVRFNQDECTFLFDTTYNSKVTLSFIELPNEHVDMEL